MAGPTAESLDIENARLRAALADATADLGRHDSSLAKLQGELKATRLEIAGARGETVQFRGMVERAQAATRIEQEKPDCIAGRVYRARAGRRRAAGGTRVGADRIAGTAEVAIVAGDEAVAAGALVVEAAGRPAAPPTAATAALR